MNRFKITNTAFPMLQKFVDIQSRSSYPPPTVTVTFHPSFIMFVEQGGVP